MFLFTWISHHYTAINTSATLILAFAAIRTISFACRHEKSRQQNEMDKECLKTADDLLKSAYEILVSGGLYKVTYRTKHDINGRGKFVDAEVIKEVVKPDRLNWLESARMISSYNNIANQIKTPRYRTLLEAKKTYWRSKIGDITARAIEFSEIGHIHTRYMLFENNYYSGLALHSIAVIYRFIHMTNDPLDESDIGCDYDFGMHSQLEGYIAHLSGNLEALMNHDLMNAEFKKLMEKEKAFMKTKSERHSCTVSFLDNP